MGLNDNPIRLDLNNPVFQEHLFGLQKPERNAAIDTLRKNTTTELGPALP